MISQNYKLIHLESVGSTNLHASALLSGKEISGPTVIMADFQETGMGQGGNSWESVSGKNLLFSLVVFPEKFKAKKQFYISKITAIAAREFLSKHIRQVKIKWPNDILVKNLKIAGILIENTLKADLLSAAVIGVGININQSEFSVPATSLLNETGKEFSRNELLDEFLGIFDYWYEILAGGDFGQIDLEYYRFFHGFQEWCKYSWGGVVFEGFVEGVEPDGYLVIKARDGKILKFGFREVDFILDQ